MNDKMKKKAGSVDEEKQPVFNKKKILKNYVEADAAVEYLFVEKAEKQVQVINDDQGYMMGYQNLYLSGPHANITWEKFRAEFLEELDWSPKRALFHGKAIKN